MDNPEKLAPLGTPYITNITKKQTKTNKIHNPYIILIVTL
jgi:hypothetical protein